MSTPYTFRYQYSLNETQIHRQTITLVIENPDGAKAGGRVIVDLKQRILEIVDDTYRVEFQQLLIDREGSLGEQVSEQLTQGTAQCWIDNRGALREHMATTMNPVPSFPEEALDPGELWTVMQPAPGGGFMQVNFCFEKVEDDVAHLVSHCIPQPGSDGGQSEIRTSLQFALKPGGALESTTVMTTLYPDGRKVNQVIHSKRVN